MDKKYRKKLDLGDGFGGFGSKKVKQEELEVTGVSRSGRVRKKSSKLMDFESPDEIDIRASRKKEKSDFGSPNVARQMKKQPSLIKQEPSDNEEIDESSFNMKEEHFSDESEMDFGPNDETSMDSMGSEMDDLDDGDMDRDEPEGFQPISGDSPGDTPPQAQSLYMMEKSNKKKLVIKDGKIVGRMKAQRKDKGKTRFTAYMLWAKEIRQELMRSNPELDFSQTSKKLGELWATVPFNEKYIWKRRAKRLAAKGNTRSGGGSASQVQSIENVAPTKKNKSPPGRKFINKAAQQSSQALSSSVASNISLSSPSESKGGKGSQGDLSGQSVFKPVGTSPLDVAAHLRLLGESLTIVGERLTEHEGQIAVSGSFSVFLDSLTCALVSLLCLTQQVPEMNVIPQEVLSQAMDNIAYIMPGL